LRDSTKPDEKRTVCTVHGFDHQTAREQETEVMKKAVAMIRQRDPTLCFGV
jgi:hypothetical protein